VPQLDHLGIAVRSIAEARQLYESLGLRVVHEETVEPEQVRIAMIPAGDTRLELLEPTQADSPVGRFLARRGEGLHHIAMQVENISLTLETLKAQGVRLISDEIRVGAGGHLYFFVHPASAGGVLLEICEDPPTE
jgi:methylmalonyl-CoA epimerase